MNQNKNLIKWTCSQTKILVILSYSNHLVGVGGGKVKDYGECGSGEEIIIVLQETP